MRQTASYKGQLSKPQEVNKGHGYTYDDDFVLDKSVFNNVFKKDIRRVFIYKKAEQIAKALHLIAPAFTRSVSLKNRADAIAMNIVDAAARPPDTDTISRELLTLSSILSIARMNGMLSAMNADLIAHEARILQREVAEYREPHLFLDAVPTLADLAKAQAPLQRAYDRRLKQNSPVLPRTIPPRGVQGHIKDIKQIKDRREAILSVIKDKGQASIKDISLLIRSVSEKTIQRELLMLIQEGLVKKEGERRWSVYALTT